MNTPSRPLRYLVLAAGLAAACTATPPGPAAPAAPDPHGWSIEARLVESCCCAPICPCIVGSSPTRGHCQGNRLVEIVDGHYGSVDVGGVDLVLTFDIGKWTRLYFGDEASEEQVEAAVKLLREQGSFISGDLLGVERVPLVVERTESTIAYTVPAAVTRVEVMRGFEDRPIGIANLRSFRDYVQYRSLEVRHSGEDESTSFEYSGTNGFAARYAASGSID